MGSYRESKAYFILNDMDSPVNIFFGVIGGFGGILAGIVITLFPMFLFIPEIYIQGQLLQKYPEEFRKEYDIRETEFYDEDYLIKHPK